MRIERASGDDGITTIRITGVEAGKEGISDRISEHRCLSYAVRDAYMSTLRGISVVGPLKPGAPERRDALALIGADDATFGVMFDGGQSAWPRYWRPVRRTGPNGETFTAKEYYAVAELIGRAISGEYAVMDDEKEPGQPLTPHDRLRLFESRFEPGSYALREVHSDVFGLHQEVFERLLSILYGIDGVRHVRRYVDFGDGTYIRCRTGLRNYYGSGSQVRPKLGGGDVPLYRVEPDTDDSPIGEVADLIGKTAFDKLSRALLAGILDVGWGSFTIIRDHTGKENTISNAIVDAYERMYHNASVRDIRLASLGRGGTNREGRALRGKQLAFVDGAKVKLSGRPVEIGLKLSTDRLLHIGYGVRGWGDDCYYTARAWLFIPTNNPDKLTRKTYMDARKINVNLKKTTPLDWTKEVTTTKGEKMPLSRYITTDEFISATMRHALNTCLDKHINQPTDGICVEN